MLSVNGKRWRKVQVAKASDVPDSQFLLSDRSRIVEARGRAGAGYSAGYPAG